MAREALGVVSQSATVIVRIDPDSPGSVTLETPLRAIQRLRTQLCSAAQSAARQDFDRDSEYEVVSAAGIESAAVVDARILVRLLTTYDDNAVAQLAGTITRHGAYVAEFSLLEFVDAVLDRWRGDLTRLEARAGPCVGALVDHILDELVRIGIKRVLPYQAQLAVQPAVNAVAAEHGLSSGQAHTLVLAASLGVPALLAAGISDLAALDHLGVTVIADPQPRHTARPATEQATRHADVHQVSSCEPARETPADRRIRARMSGTRQPWSKCSWQRPSRSGTNRRPRGPQ
ncbi:hypothetical protein [Amycolatopsis sp. NBC_01480]|uniref:hypothetical protein n=1 Tax=Amycolatopsis sp. NBC_01480 TaxID=2903562 RepID=UPI002E29C7E5|nr:hypothetical protein [Amycolatopsis sp. NBC_01480]